MTSPEAFPDDPTRRRALVVLNRGDYDGLNYREGGADLLYGEDVFPLAWPGTAPSPVLAELGARGLLRPGAVLLQSPFDVDDYEDAGDAATHFAIAKHLHFCRVCQHLGAKKVKAEQRVAMTEKERVVAQLDVAHVAAAGTAKVTDERLAKLDASLRIEHLFDGGEPDVDGALEYVRRHGLGADRVIKDLIEAARIRNNRTKSQMLTVQLSTEAKRQLEVATRIAVPAYLTAIEANVKVAREQKSEFSVTLRVDF